MLLTVFLLNFSCGRSYLPGFNFKSFKGSPVEELSYAVEQDDVEGVNAFVDEHPELIDYQEREFGHSLLFLAVVNDKYNAAKALLDRGASLSVRSYADSADVLMVLCKHYSHSDCDTSMLKLVLSYKPDMKSYCYNNPSDKTSLLTNACYSTLVCLDFIKILVDSGADINYLPDGDPAGSPICMAILLHRLDIARYFIIEKKAKIPEYCIRRPEKDSYILITVPQMLQEQTYEARLPADRARLLKQRDELLTYINALDTL